MAASSPSPPAPEAARADAAASDEAAALDAVYRTGPILAAVQRARVWRDCKDFLDTPTRAPPSAVLAAWRADPPEGDAAVRAFARRWFHDGPPNPTLASARGPGPALADWDPRGPPFALEYSEWVVLNRGDDDVLAWVRDFAVKVHALWPTLARPPTAPRGAGTGAEAPLFAGTNASETAAPAKTTAPGETVPPNPEIPAAASSASSSPSSFSTLLPTPRVAIVPGERFRETYYWDSHWTVLGLIASGMLVTAEGVVENLFALVDAHGFVPNGARRYYLNRAQPPVLASTVRALMEAYERRDEAWRLANPPDPEPESDSDEEDEFADDDPNRPPSLAGSEPPEVVVPESDAVRLAKKALPRLLREYRYLTRRERVVRVRVDKRRVAKKDIVGEHADLARYWAYTDEPRPESFREDEETADEAVALELERDADAADAHHPDAIGPEREGVYVCGGPERARAIRARVYRDLASAAESGHDFASRWLANEEATENVARLSSGFGNWKRVDRPASLATIRTTRVVPADLNALMLKMESDVSWIAGVICEDDASRDRWRKDSEAAEAKARFAVAANRRRVVLNATLWDEDEGRWRDLLLEPRASDPEIASSDTATVLTPMWFVPGVRASDFVPLWCGAAEPGGARATRAFHSLRKSGLVLPGGVACSLRFNGHQWDYPNAWAPLVHAIVEGLDACCGAEGAALARDVARRWLKSVAQILRRSGFMHEKYDARTIGGAVGGGGEYAPQRGFGWTNGVALVFLEKYCYDGKSKLGRGPPDVGGWGWGRPEDSIKR